MLDMRPYMAPEESRAAKAASEENGIEDDLLHPENTIARASCSDEQLESSMYR